VTGGKPSYMSLVLVLLILKLPLTKSRKKVEVPVYSLAPSKNFAKQYNSYRVSVSKTGEKIESHFNGLVAYLVVNLNLK
jgi:hypothetical protein